MKTRPDIPIPSIRSDSTMNSRTVGVESDLWSEWLLHDRHGGDALQKRLIQAAIDGHVDRVLDAARLIQGMTLADVGTGDGSVAFRAIDRVGPSLRVHMADVSAPLLRHAESLATQRDVIRQCTFHQCSACNLDGLEDSSVDAVTTRAVLAYVHDKRTALREFHRVLKPGGRLSIAEPLLQEEALNASALRLFVESEGGSRNSILSLLHRWKSAQFPDSPEKMAESPIANYSERDLFGLVKDCGFIDVHLEFHMDIRAVGPGVWDTFLDSTPHPMAPSLRAILDQQFSVNERLTLEQYVRPIVESGTATEIDRIVYLSAAKPSSGGSSANRRGPLMSVDGAPSLRGEFGPNTAQDLECPVDRNDVVGGLDNRPRR